MKGRLALLVMVRVFRLMLRLSRPLHRTPCGPPPPENRERSLVTIRLGATGACR
jgi:hypothetical protein